ncbi:MAG: 2-amino-4-hydroxy-6-hydroxymethyldihydropteridine diphosphokinase [Dysgonamonadaceae bacterium]|nr:2-amino-4-hydroxy-6-hydroxymethyldihydropteridine diphosphokinase [Dysgonamonadaceae bacterium]
MSTDNYAEVQSHTNLSSVYLGLGTNLGDKQKNIEVALEKIEEQIGRIISLSALYLSKPHGFKSNNLFVNCAINVETALTPLELLVETQSIEKEMGRTDKLLSSGYTDRIIDIDILFYKDFIINNNPNFIVPHPHIQERDFVLKPMSEIAPNFIHPVLKKSISELLSRL